MSTGGSTERAVSATALPYRAPRWLPEGHSQTIVPALLAPLLRLVPPISFRRERWDTPDGDFIDLDWLTSKARPNAGLEAEAKAGFNSGPEAVPNDVPNAGANAPLFVLFHGLEGNSDSHYARTLMAGALNRGWAGVVPHFRSCSGSLNLAPRFYHSGDSTEIDWILRRLRTLHRGPLLVAGVSLGGNALLRWLGERQHDADFICAAAAISAPLDLQAGGAALGGGLNRIYTRNFLKTLKRKSALKLQQHPRLFDLTAMLASRTLYEFDNVVTAPLHGYRDTDDYWLRASAKTVLSEITVPTLVLNARNDPFLPARALPTGSEVSQAVTLEQPEHGGHVGFMTRPFPGRLDWLAERLANFFEPLVPHG
jgi:predicted alpha/beta-fold hydrolase